MNRSTATTSHVVSSDPGNPESHTEDLEVTAEQERPSPDGEAAGVSTYQSPAAGRSGLSRLEWRLLAVALVGIAIWGFTGVDWEVLNQGTGPESIAAAGLADSENNLADSGSRDATPESAISRGQAVFEANGCNACHSIDGSKKIGPSLKGVWGMEQVHVDGSTAIMDVDYFNESVLEPQARIIEGYGSAMPSYQDLVTPEQLADLAAYVESLE